MRAQSLPSNPVATDGAQAPERPVAALRPPTPAVALGAPRMQPRACVHESFLGHAAHRPQALASVDARRRLDYGELMALAAGVADELRAAGVRPSDRVCVCLEASTHVPVALLGVLLVGAAYVPVDPETPVQRIAEVLRDSGARVLVTESAALDRLPRGVPHVLVEQSGATTQSPTASDMRALAYIVYTSGTTGRPKGVAVDHASLAAVVRESAALLDVHRGARVLQHTSLGFDPATLEVFLALTTGGSLVHASRDVVITPGGLESLIATHAAEVWIGTPTLLGLVDPDRVPTLARLAVGGEVMPPHLAQRWAPGRRCFNVYGPSEGTVLTTAYRCTGTERLSPPIGRPLPGRHVVVVDEQLCAVAPGELGEICLGGLALARGYWKRERLTADRFVALPTPAPAGWFYRTGDLGRLTSDGMLHFVGRVDRQVKLRGHRVEPEEVERTLMGLPGVAEAAVTTQGTSDGARLVAYVVGAGEDAPSEDELRAGLARRLPRYMLPHRVIATQTLPRTTNGKIATDKLRPSDRLRSVSTSRGAAIDLEQLLLGIFRETLERSDVNVDDDFFVAGGDSLAAVHVLTAAVEAGLTITPATFYAERSVARLAAALRAGEPAVATPV